MLSRPTTKAAENQRITTAKTATILSRLDGLRRSEMLPHDLRIFPGSYGLVMIVENGRRVVKPMRYQCRPAARPALLRSQVPRHLQRPSGQFEGLLEGSIRGEPRGHGRQRVLLERLPALDGGTSRGRGRGWRVSRPPWRAAAGVYRGSKSSAPAAPLPMLGCIGRQPSSPATTRRGSLRPAARRSSASLAGDKLNDQAPKAYQTKL